MNIKKYLLIAAVIVAALLPSASSAQKAEVEKLYMFGFAASFNDTIVHFTDIQAVDSAWVNTKNHYLLGREQYSAMLRNYLTEKNMPNRTCIVIYNKKLKKIQKKYLKMKKLYTGTKKVKTNNIVETISASEFQFKPVNMNPVQEEEETTEQPKKSKKKKK